MKILDDILDAMEPAEALTSLGPHLHRILTHLDEETRVDFITGLLQDAGQDKVASMVHL